MGTIVGVGVGVGYGQPAALESLSDIPGLAAWWDLDHAVITADVLISATDRALGATINVVGSPAVVTIDGQQYVRFDGTDDVLWIADAAPLDGATGVTFVMKHANTEALPANVAFCAKGQAVSHWNGGLSGNGSAGTRFTARMNSLIADIGPLAEFTSPAETIACAMESGVAVRRVDGDGTYASNATAVVVQVGPGALTWGAYDANVGPVFGAFAGIDIRAAAYFNVPLGQADLEKAWRILART